MIFDADEQYYSNDVTVGDLQTAMRLANGTKQDVQTKLLLESIDYRDSLRQKRVSRRTVQMVDDAFYCR